MILYVLFFHYLIFFKIEFSVDEEVVVFLVVVFLFVSRSFFMGLPFFSVAVRIEPGTGTSL